jgi:hypothetical protein
MASAREVGAALVARGRGEGAARRALVPEGGLALVTTGPRAVIGPLAERLGRWLPCPRSPRTRREVEETSCRGGRFEFHTAWKFTGIVVARLASPAGLDTTVVARLSRGLSRNGDATGKPSALSTFSIATHLAFGSGRCSDGAGQVTWTYTLAEFFLNRRGSSDPTLIVNVLSDWL